MSPFFSIIIPVYNVEKYLCQCLQSVLEQTCKDYEVILVENNSTDGSMAVCVAYARENERMILVHESKQGLSVARNTGASKSNGEYLIFMDSDDWWEDKDFLYKAKIALQEHRADMLIFGNVSYSEEKQEYIEKRKYKEQGEYRAENIVPKLVAEDRFFISAWSRVIKRTKFVAFNDELKYQEDMEWIFRQYHEVDTVYVLNEYIYCYRRRKGSISNTIQLDALKKRIDIYEQNMSYIRSNEWNGDMQNALLSYLSYQYFLIISDVGLLADKNAKVVMSDRLKEYEWIQAYALGKKARISCRIIRIFGVIGGANILACYRRLLNIYRAVN